MKNGDHLAECDHFNLICDHDKDKGLLFKKYPRSISGYWNFILKTISQKPSAVLVSSESNLIFLLILVFTQRQKRLITFDGRLNHLESRSNRLKSLGKFLILRNTYHHFLALNKSSPDFLQAKRVPKHQISYFPQMDLPENFELKSPQQDKKVIIAVGVEGNHELAALREISLFQFPDSVEILVESDKANSEDLFGETLDEKCQVKTVTTDELKTLYMKQVDLFIDLNSNNDWNSELLVLMANGIPCICSSQNVLASDLVLPGINGFLYSGSNSTMLAEEIKLGLYFTHSGRRREQAEEIKAYHTPAYRYKLIMALLQPKREHVPSY